LSPSAGSALIRRPSREGGGRPSSIGPRDARDVGSLSADFLSLIRRSRIIRIRLSTPPSLYSSRIDFKTNRNRDRLEAGIST
jgi:hypothetical protein